MCFYSKKSRKRKKNLQPATRATNSRAGNLQHLQPAMQATNSGVEANMRHLGAVGLQPTALTASNAGYKQQGW
jgi:hypothetical protein